MRVAHKVTLKGLIFARINFHNFRILVKFAKICLRKIFKEGQLGKNNIRGKVKKG